ncbi:integrin alpha-5-like [Homalodisca vitripennis]|uniref:integrin alpha-5-like n=1 Tax=Homalodisca vitripennis TaxID=197043 RepID=UPI001EEA807C|nr:integrin alpha-5-like [Homalodisca vitripennis]
MKASGWTDQDGSQGRPVAGPADTTDLLQRRRRSLTTWSFNDTNTDELRVKRALYLNCSGGKEVQTGCALVKCEVGPLTTQNRAEVNLELFINRTVLGTMLSDVDLIQMSSVGRVDIIEPEKYDVPWEHRSKVTTVDTVMMGEVGGDGLPSWILPLSIILGLLLLLLLIKFLSNCGFFKRTTKEKLRTMKEKAAEDEFEVINFHSETNDDTKTFDLDKETQ